MSAMDNSINLIQNYYNAFNQRDWDKFFSLLSENVAHDLNQGPRQVGIPAFREFIAEMNRCYSEKVVDLVVMGSPDGERLAAEFIIEGTYLQTQQGLPEAKGQTYRLAVGAFFEVRQNKVARITNYYNLPEWVRQVNQ